MRPKRVKTPSSSDVEMEPVEVFARIKTVSPTEDTCVDFVDERTVDCKPPPDVVSDKGSRATFTKVFNQGAAQSAVYDEICRPMVKRLLKGKSGLLFNYGVTSSGKTYTMTGSPNQPGFLPRAMEMIFSSIDGHQTKEFRVTSDDRNGFKLLSETDMMTHRLEKRNELVHSRIASRGSTNTVPNYNIDEHYMESLSEGFQYAVFMTYCDIYNESLDDPERGVYGHNITVKEVRSLEDALREYERGLKQRRMAETSLNRTSSRSHAIMSLHVVRIPYDRNTGDVFEDQVEDVTSFASSLHLVDLAGSERQSRTNAAGDRLREAGNINNSLMTLRRCIDILRQNQRTGARGNVPYRSSKITHMFRNFFEILGGVKLVICLNPAASEFNENLDVLNFAEAAQAIVCKREIKEDIEEDFTAREEQAAMARAKKNKRRTIFQPWMVNEEALAHGPPLPCVELFSCDDAEMIPQLIDIIRQRVERREIIGEETDRLTTTFRKKLNHFERENVDALGKLRILEPQVEKIEGENDRLLKDNRRLEKKNRALMEAQRVYELDKKEAEAELQAMNNKLENESKSKRQIEAAAKRKMEDERRKLNMETSRKLREAEENSKNRLNLNEAKMDQLRNILSKNSPRTPVSRVNREVERVERTPVSSARTRNLRKRSVSETRMKEEAGITPGMSVKTPSASNIKENRPPRPGRSQERGRGPTTDHLAHKRRSKSADKWLAHTPKETIDPGTVLQPKVIAKKNVHIPSVGDLKTVDQYLLTHQELGTGNQVKTTLVKGEVYGTRTGGTQVRFTGKEKLTSGTSSEFRRK
ncbi:Oidioi.mRNA.OKI2018_I69.PAR.g12516.t2.cds [Oikopleura dioica]|uniref:Kinesin-like protein n=1 Tax=Oikopleura dioica TaxID=34765 RepID=A0ABN7S7E1_OIKDI|nr:Oidioi.mRNA.OKI2018_I69.PAR.g12516.t2.cds [Oikopleura dioica]